MTGHTLLRDEKKELKAHGEREREGGKSSAVRALIG